MESLLEPLSVELLYTVLKWRNSEHIRFNMYNYNIISIENHRKWFEKIKSSNRDKYFVFFLNKKPVGVVYFNNISFLHNEAEWGFYIGDTNAPKGSGLYMGLMALDYVFNQLNLHQIHGEVLEFNKPSLEYHTKLGFRLDSIQHNKIKRNNEYYNIVRYSLLKQEWEVSRPSVLQSLRDKGMYK